MPRSDAPTAQPETVPVLFDTDIGDDIDDAVALAYLLRQPRCELVGITTVFRDPPVRAALADAVCRAAGRTDVPIRAGAAAPLFGPPPHPVCPQAEILDRFEHAPPSAFEPNAAVPFLRDRIRSRPGEIVLLAVGPMTNIGLLFAMDPEIPRLLRGLILMCGDFEGQAVPGRYAEWNASCDADATALVYAAARGCPNLSVGLNVTLQCNRAAAEVIARFRAAGGPLSVVAEAAEIWKRGLPDITFHDPLAAAAVFEPGLLEYGDCRVDVVRNTGLVDGLTRWNPRAAERPHRVALGVNAPAFFDHYFAIAGA